MSPPRCHSGNSDNGTPAFSNTSSGITPEPRHHIFKPWGAEAEPLLALRGSAWSAGCFGHCIQSGDVRCCVLTFHFYTLVLWLIKPLPAPHTQDAARYETAAPRWGRRYRQSPRWAAGVIKALPQRLVELRLVKNELIPKQIIFCHCGSQ